jgi:hypothetical protein
MMAVLLLLVFGGAAAFLGSQAKDKADTEYDEKLKTAKLIAERKRQNAIIEAKNRKILEEKKRREAARLAALARRATTPRAEIQTRNTSGTSPSTPTRMKGIDPKDLSGEDWSKL